MTTRLKATRIGDDRLRVRVIMSGEVKESSLIKYPARMKAGLKKQWLEDLAASIDSRDFENPVIHSMEDAPASARLTDIAIELYREEEANADDTA